MKLYDIQTQYQTILDQFEDVETPEQIDALTEELSAIQDALEIKAEAYCVIYRTLTANAEAFKAEEDRLKQRRQYAEAAAERVKRGLEFTMLSLGVRKLEAGTFTPAIQKNAPSVDVQNEDAIPDKYLIPQAPKIDKRLILIDLKAGAVIEGCEIKQTESIRIK
jgi:hypothetical protein